MSDKGYLECYISRKDNTLEPRTEPYMVVECIDKEDWERLRDMIGKARPKRPIKDARQAFSYVQTYTCPTCGGSFCGNPQYCYHCGQRFSWEASNESAFDD